MAALLSRGCAGLSGHPLDGVSGAGCFLLERENFASGWLAQCSDGVIRNAFVPVAFAVAPSESGTATHLMDRALMDICRRSAGSR